MLVTNLLNKEKNNIMEKQNLSAATNQILLQENLSSDEIRRMLVVNQLKNQLCSNLAIREVTEIYKL
jgi:hypothetical protein